MKSNRDNATKFPVFFKKEKRRQIRILRRKDILMSRLVAPERYPEEVQLDI